MANRIFLVYANNKDRPLPTLREEDDKLFELLSQREQKEHFKLHRDSYITTRKLGRYLNQYRDEIILFHYSGHADRDQLFLEDKPAMARGVANFLAKCPNLKLVVLNGCSTQGQVRRLLDLETKPVVIATNAPVGDHSATLFSISFYEQFCMQEKTVKESFDIALNQVQLSEKDVSVTKGVGIQTNRSGENEAVWGLFPQEGVRLNWKIPTQVMEMQTSSFVPNRILIQKLLTAFAPFYERADKVLKKGEAAAEADKIKAILEPLALPISEHLRKLMTPEQIGSAHKFFDRLGSGRLNQIGIAYSAIIELIAFILLADLWDFRANKRSIVLSEEQSKDLKYFFSLSYDDRQSYNFPKLIQKLRDILAQNKAKLFVEEIALLPKFDDPSNELGAATADLEDLKNRSVDRLDENEIRRQCIKGEEMLATLFSRLAFITQYNIRSVKSIDVYKYRHSAKPSYSHKVVKLIQTFINKLQEDQEERPEIMYTASVCLLKNGEKGYLNLSPFVIDQNAFDETAELAKLHYFEVYEKDTDSFAFKHIYKPEEFSLETAADKKTYQMIKEQFDAFTRLLFNEPIQAL